MRFATVTVYERSLSPPIGNDTPSYMFRTSTILCANAPFAAWGAWFKGYDYLYWLLRSNRQRVAQRGHDLDVTRLDLVHIGGNGRRGSYHALVTGERRVAGRVELLALFPENQVRSRGHRVTYPQKVTSDLFVQGHQNSPLIQDFDFLLITQDHTTACYRSECQAERQNTWRQEITVAQIKILEFSNLP